jgi:hypothetical protein
MLPFGSITAKSLSEAPCGEPADATLSLDTELFLTGAQLTLINVKVRRAVPNIPCEMVAFFTQIPLLSLSKKSGSPVQDNKKKM